MSAGFGAGFRSLVTEAQWMRLPPAVRRRFGEPGRADVFAGEVAACELTGLARAFDVLGRWLGAPLPICDDIGAAVVVSVVDDGAGGQFWTRTFHGRRGFPRVIQSRMSFLGPSGLEEALGIGLAMAIDLDTSAEGLHFVSRGCALAFGGLRLPLPDWLTPGAMRLDHIDRGEHAFAVTISLTHPWFGRVLRQTCEFRDLAEVQTSSASSTR